MDWIKNVQEIVPWLAGLPPLPKSIVTFLIVGSAAFVLVLIWTPPVETAVQTILTDCYRRALFTRMHAELNQDAMFASIDECRLSVQKNPPLIHRKGLKKTAFDLLGTLELIGRHNPIKAIDDVDAINALKVAALRSFGILADATGGEYTLPAKGELAETMYFTQEEANAPPSGSDFRIQTPISPPGGAIQ